MTTVPSRDFNCHFQNISLEQTIKINERGCHSVDVHPVIVILQVKKVFKPADELNGEATEKEL